MFRGNVPKLLGLWSRGIVPPQMIQLEAGVLQTILYGRAIASTRCQMLRDAGVAWPGPDPGSAPQHDDEVFVCKKEPVILRRTKGPSRRIRLNTPTFDSLVLRVPCASGKGSGAQVVRAPARVGGLGSRWSQAPRGCRKKPPVPLPEPPWPCLSRPIRRANG